MSDEPMSEFPALGKRRHLPFLFIHFLFSTWRNLELSIRHLRFYDKVPVRLYTIWRLQKTKSSGILNSGTWRFVKSLEECYWLDCIFKNNNDTRWSRCKAHQTAKENNDIYRSLSIHFYCMPVRIPMFWWLNLSVLYSNTLRYCTLYSTLYKLRKWTTSRNPPKSIFGYDCPTYRAGRGK